ncbi:large subunit ribosomal protein L22 [Paragonimus westermani]|uniref:Large ribosomal subunit protein uL22m n=1 Tax=Paragonimus westermani TaxID=34504 RepID=A0A5J4NFK2_9TREM|nr:large subunit ribosomal protein L22 [Paragonimus westermani]
MLQYAHSDRIPDSSRSRIISKATGRKEDLWQLYNEVVYPPTVPTGNQLSDVVHHKHRPAEVTHRREDILYSQKKLWLLGFMIRGRAIDDAFVQLAYRPEKGARILEEVLEEAVELAVKEHDFEYCTKIWIETIHVNRGRSVPRLYKGLRTQISLNNYHYANLYIRLREGDPPAVYHARQIAGNWTPAANCPASGRPAWGSGHDMLHREVERMRERRFKWGL